MILCKMEMLHVWIGEPVATAEARACLSLRQIYSRLPDCFYFSCQKTPSTLDQDLPAVLNSRLSSLNVLPRA